MNATKTFAKTQAGMTEARAFYATCKGDASLTVSQKDEVITVSYTEKKKAVATIKVVEAKKGAEVFGFTAGDELTIESETKAYFFCITPKNGPVKVSKKTGLACQWSDKNTSPVFKLN